MSGYTEPAVKVVAVTKANADLPDGPAKSLLVGTAGTLNIMDYYGTVVANVPVQQGYNPIRVKQVRTGGTATDIFALY